MFIIEFRNGPKTGYIANYNEIGETLTTTINKHNAMSFVTLTAAAPVVRFAKEGFGMTSAKAVALETSRFLIKVRFIDKKDFGYVSQYPDGTFTTYHSPTHSGTVKLMDKLSAVKIMQAYIKEHGYLIELIEVIEVKDTW